MIMHQIKLRDLPVSAVPACACSFRLQGADDVVAWERACAALADIGVGHMHPSIVFRAPSKAIPAGMPRVFMPSPSTLFAALPGKTISDKFSSACMNLCGKFDLNLEITLYNVLDHNLVEPCQHNLDAWSTRRVKEDDDVINMYVLGLSPTTRFEHNGAPFAISATDANTVLPDNGAIPGSLLEWLFATIQYPRLKESFYASIVHPGSYVKQGAHRATGCYAHDNKKVTSYPEVRNYSLSDGRRAHPRWKIT